MTARRNFVPNQIFVGLPWKNVREKYDRIIDILAKKYPLFFTIIGRDDGRDAAALFEIIKERIRSSSYAVFDATAGNANVSLEYGYAEGLDVPRAIFLSDHKAAQRSSGGQPIISDLTGMRRFQYKNETRLAKEMGKVASEHDFTKRFEKALQTMHRKKSKGAKKSGRALALKAVRALNGKATMRRAALVQHLQALGYGIGDIELVLKGLRNHGVLPCTQGRYADVSIG